MDIATVEQKAKIEQIRAKTAIMSGTSEEETEDDGFIEALKGEVADVWEEE
jgi:phage terminase small subunit